jgi:hypothetical protein
VSKVLVVALDAAEPPSLTADSVLVVAPAVNSRLRRWLSDEDGARRRAEKRLEAYVERIAAAAKIDVSLCRRLRTLGAARRPAYLTDKCGVNGTVLS